MAGAHPATAPGTKLPRWKEKWIGVFLPLRYIFHPPLRLLRSILLLRPPLQSAAHSSSCQGEAVLHGEAPMPLSNFTLEWSWAEHANPDITKQIKSRGWAQRGGRVLRLLGWMGGGQAGRIEGGAVVKLAEQLSAHSDQDILGGESLIEWGWRWALVGDSFVAARHGHEKAMMVGN